MESMSGTPPCCCCTVGILCSRVVSYFVVVKDRSSRWVLERSRLVKVDRPALSQWRLSLVAFLLTKLSFKFNIMTRRSRVGSPKQRG
jgi:hypothetical protein